MSPSRSEIVGANVVKLKQNHAATRARCSLMTCTTNIAKVASRLRRPSLCLLLKAKSDRGITKLREYLPKDVRFCLMHSEKGSFRKDEFLAYLDWLLDPWTEERREAADYVFLYFDVAKCHLGPDVIDFAWKRGYICQLIYGGCTGLLQVNDTDCHGPFESVYLDFETQSFHDKQTVDPSDISRAPWEVIQDVSATWRALDHERIGKGYARVGCSNKLDGTQDEDITRDARKIWEAANMNVEREAAIKEVDDRVASGELKSFSDWRKLVIDPNDMGVMEEGFEFEGDLRPGENPWQEDGEYEKMMEEDFPTKAEVSHHEEEEATALTIVAPPNGDPELVAEARRQATLHQDLGKLLALAKAVKEPVAARVAAEAKLRLERGAPKRSRGGISDTNDLFRAAVRNKQAQEAAELKKLRSKAWEAKRLRAKEAAEKAAAKRKADKEKEERAALKKKIQLLPTTWGAGVLGSKTKGGNQAREDCLEKLKLRSPKLTLADEVKWPETRKTYAARFPIHHPAGTGKLFCEKIREVTAKLGPFLRGTNKYAKAGDAGRAAHLVMYSGFVPPIN